MRGERKSTGSRQRNVVDEKAPCCVKCAEKRRKQKNVFIPLLRKAYQRRPLPAFAVQHNFRNHAVVDARQGKQSW